jgi:hypothetical protein
MKRGIFRAILIAVTAAGSLLGGAATAAEGDRFDILHAEVVKLHQFIHNPTGKVIVRDSLRVRRDAQFRKDVRILGNVTVDPLANCTALETNAAGQMSCGTDDGESYTDGNGLTLAGNEFLVDETATFAWSGAQSWSNDLIFSSLVNCTALETDGSGAVTCGSDADTTQSLQTAYDTGGSITTADAKDIDITLENTTTDGNLDIDIASDSISTVSISRSAGSGTNNPNQLLLIEDLDGDLTIADGLRIETAGALSDALQIGSGTQAITNAINIGSTGVTTDLRLQNGETIDNDADGTIAIGATTTELNSALNASGAVQFDSTFDVAGTAGFDSSIAINGGTAITGHLSESTTFDGASIAAASCGDLGNITVTGAATGDTVYAAPTPAANGIEDLNLTWSAFVSAADTVIIRACNTQTLGAQDPDSQAWRVDIWKH